MVNVTLFFNILQRCQIKACSAYTSDLTLLIYVFDQAQKLEVALASMCMRREFSNTQINFISFHYSLEVSLDMNKYTWMKTWLH